MPLALCFGKISNLKLYATNESYDTVNPTGYMAEIALKGKHFANGAVMELRVAKGVDGKYSKKSMTFAFEDGSYARLAYIGSERESKENRGDFRDWKTLRKGESSRVYCKPLREELVRDVR